MFNNKQSRCFKKLLMRRLHFYFYPSPSDVFFLQILSGVLSSKYFFLVNNPEAFCGLRFCFLSDHLRFLEFLLYCCSKFILNLLQFTNFNSQVFEGYLDNEFNTDNAWLETVVYNFHDEENIIKKFLLSVSILYSCPL